MDLRALRRQRVGGKNDIVLPAVESADPSVGTCKRPQPDGVAIAPHRTLDMRRLQLPVPAQNDAFSADKQQRAIDRAKRVGVLFDDPDHHVDRPLLCGGAKFVGRWARNRDSVGVILGHRSPAQRSEGRVDKERVTRKPGLPEGGDGRAGGRCFFDQAASLVCRSLAVEQDVGRLDRGHSEMSLSRHAVLPNMGRREIRRALLHNESEIILSV